jgi:hypothetical protein
MSTSSQPSGVVGQLSSILIGLISSGAVLRLIFCLIRMATDEEQCGMYMKRAVNACVFLILSISVWMLKDLVLRYFSI